MRDASLGALKRRGIVAVLPPARQGGDEQYPLPRIHAVWPRPGHAHPASPADVAAVLRCFGPACSYGLRAIELAPGPDVTPARGLAIARLVGPGAVRLYDQPPSPWRIAGLLRHADAERLGEAGAIVENVGGVHTLVHWPGQSLRDFMLFDGLMHEIGHHLVQQYTGKRTAHVRRTRDHEAYAHRFAARCRRAWQAAAEPA
jgi:hypothetical protein